ncbi:MAG: hypothetical protein M0Q49_02140 [Porticoccaceae bacterium]|nr:hypothetical protein [Porticoccaceae bacterium]
MALLFETPFPHTQGQRRLHIARLISSHPGADGDKELLKFCRSIGIPARVIHEGIVRIGGTQLQAARCAGAREVTSGQLDKIIRSKTHG